MKSASTRRPQPTVGYSEPRMRRSAPKVRLTVPNNHAVRAQNKCLDNRNRRGNILVLAAALIVGVFAFAAFTLDLGFAAVTKSQMATADDASALAACLELYDGLGINPEKSASEVETAADQAAVDIAALHKSGNLNSAYVNASRDVRLGQREWDANANAWVDQWGVSPYNMVEVTLHRDQGSGNGGDQSLPLFFGPVIGHEDIKLQTVAAAAVLAATGFKIEPGSPATAQVLPIVYDLPSWQALLNGTGADNYSYDPDTGQVTPGSDGILEADIYPEAAPGGNGNGNGNNQWTPGNRGTVDFGNPNNSTADLARQILNGLNDDDLSYFNGEISFENGSLDVNGDPGISAGIKDELAAIIGQPRAIALFTQVTGQGNNTTYTLVQFVGIRIVDVKLTGGNKYVYVQPATLIDSTAVPGGNVTVEEATIFATAKLIK